MQNQITTHSSGVVQSKRGRWIVIVLT